MFESLFLSQVVIVGILVWLVFGGIYDWWQHHINKRNNSQATDNKIAVIAHEK